MSRLLRDDTALEAPDEHDAHVSPGRVPVTARIAGRPQFIFRVASVEAARELAGALGPRDDNGVAAGADVAVDRAASSSGAALPGDVRSRFESSLGADLSGVRVHTGTESAAAASAVGARAYTVGNDIHFADGQYTPGDPFGLHLLAHEVAHTQQQAGAAPHRQNKLEVSTPGDSAEVEADRAADAMVSGAQASVSGAGGVARMIQRDPAPAGAAAPAAGAWQPPFLEMAPATDTVAASERLLDMKAKLDAMVAAGFDELTPIGLHVLGMANQMAGNHPLGESQLTQLRTLGVEVFGAYSQAVNQLKAMIQNQLSQWTSGLASGAGGEDAMAELLHATFMDSPGEDKLAEVKEAVGKVHAITEKVSKYSGYAVKAMVQVMAADRLEKLHAGLEEVTGKIKEAEEIVDLADNVLVLFGKIGQRPGGAQNDIAKFRAAVNIVDFAISKSKVPMIGTVWSSMIKPCTELVLQQLSQLAKMDDQANRGDARADEWFQAALAGSAAPQIAAFPGDKKRLAGLFPGGQPMLDFMWDVFRKGQVGTVPQPVQDMFLKFKAQFNAGHDEGDRIEEKSNKKLTDPTTWAAAPSTPNLADWVLKNKVEIWEELYGQMPHP